jgi:hypothetical protein
MKKIYDFIVWTTTISGEFIVFLSMLAFTWIAITLLVDGIWQPVVMGAIFLAGAPCILRFLKKPWTVFSVNLIDEDTGDARSMPLFFLLQAFPVVIMSSWAAFNYYFFVDMTYIDYYWKFAIFSCFLAINPIRRCLNPYNMQDNVFARYMTSSFIYAYILACMNIYTNYFSLVNSIAILYIFPLLCYIIWFTSKIFFPLENLSSDSK